MSDAEGVAGYASVGAVVHSLSAHDSKKGAIWGNFNIVCSTEKQRENSPFVQGGIIMCVITKLFLFVLFGKVLID